MDSWNDIDVQFEQLDTADPSPLHRLSFDRTIEDSIEDDTEHFRQYVKTNKHLLGNGMIKRDIRYKNLSPGRKISGQGRIRSGNSSKSPLYNNFLQEPDRIGAQNMVESSTREKPDWNNRITIRDSLIPAYNSANDKHLRRHKRMMMSRKTKTLSAAYKPIPPRSFAKKSKSNTSTHSPSSIHKGKSKLGWSASKENADPQFAVTDNDQKSHQMQHQMQQRLEDLTKMLESKENELKQVKIDKVNRERTLEKLKDKMRKQKEIEESLKLEKSRLEEKLNHFSKKKSSKITNSGSKTLTEVITKQKQQLQQLQNEVNMFKIQNQMLRAQENEKDTKSASVSQEYHEEIMKLRKQIRIEKERTKSLREKLEEQSKASNKIGKLRNYLEKEKKDSSKVMAQSAKLQQQYQETKAQLQAFQQKIEELAKEKEDLINSLQQVRNVVSAQKKKIEQLENNSLSLGKKLMDMEKTTSGEAKAKENVKQLVLEKEEDLKRVTRHVTQLEKEKSDLESQYTTVTSECEALKEKNKFLNKKLQSQINVNQDVSEMTEKIELLQLENTQLKKDHTTLKTVYNECEVLKRENSSIKAENRSSIEKIAHLQSNMKNLQLSLTEKDNEIKQALLKNAQLQAKLEERTCDISHIEELQKKLKEVSERCNVLSESNSLLLLRLKREESKNK